MTQPKSPRVNPTRGAPNYAELLRLILSVILRVYSRHDSVGENSIRTSATRLGENWAIWQRPSLRGARNYDWSDRCSSGSAVFVFQDYSFGSSVLIELGLAPKDIAALTILMIVVPLLIFAVIRMQ